jgi:hypothetical protein
MEGARMRGTQSVVFDIGLAVCGCFLIFPVIRWLWPFDRDVSGNFCPLIAAFVASYTFVRIVDWISSRIETAIAMLFYKSERKRAEEDV